MKKKEIIWRHILVEALHKGKAVFTQKNVAETFHVSTSTVFNALQAPRKLGAIAVTGRNFRLADAEKLLLLWATHRRLQVDIIYETRVDKPPRAIEGMMPGGVIFGAYSAYRLSHHDAPADYDKVYVYSDDLETLRRRFPPQKGAPNLFVLKPDPWLKAFGAVTPDVQTFVDLWNLSDWYSRDFWIACKKIIPL